MAKTDFEEKAKGFIANCDDCNIPLLPFRQVQDRQAMGEPCGYGVAVRYWVEKYFLCNPCYAKTLSKQYLPGHPKADKKGFVKSTVLKDEHKYMAEETDNRERIKHLKAMLDKGVGKELPYDKNERAA